MESVGKAGSPQGGTPAKTTSDRKTAVPPEGARGAAMPAMRGGESSQKTNAAAAEGPGKALGGIGGAIDIKA